VAEPASLLDLRRRCEAMLPRVDIGELILEVMGWHPELTAAYTHIAGGGARMADLPITLSAVLTAQALNIGWTPVISPRGAGVDPGAEQPRLPELRAGRDTRCRERGTDRRAGRRRHRRGVGRGPGRRSGRHPLRRAGPLHHARPNPKYFGRRKGATYLNMVNDQGVEVAGMVLSGTPRDSLHAIDLMYRRDGGHRPEVLISDTGSYTDMVFGLLKLLGVAYRPELADLPDQSCGASPPPRTTARSMPPPAAVST
jgi:hypothetical protein